LRRVWRSVVEENQPRPSTAEVSGWYHLGLVDPAQLDEQLTYAGMNPGIWSRLFRESFHPLPLDWSIRQHFLGKIGDVDLKAIADRHGFARTPGVERLWQFPEPHTLGDLYDLRNRGWITEGQFEAQLKALGYRDHASAFRQGNLRFVIPGPADQIRFALREVWRTDIVERYGYDQQFPPEFDFWAKKVGLSYPIGEVFPDAGNFADLTWAKAYWRAHWEVMSPTQSYHALHRFRPREPGSQWSVVEGIKAFTVDDARRMLNVADYAPGVVDWLIGLSYHPLTRVDVRRMLRIGTITPAEAKSAYLDQGYDELNAQRLADFSVQEAAFSRNQKGHARAVSAVIRAYRAGAIGRDEAGAQLYLLFQPQRPGAGQAPPPTFDTARALGKEDPQVQRELGIADLERAAQRAKEQQRAVRAAFISGELDEPQARDVLGRAGTDSDRAAELVRDWGLVRLVRARRLTAPQTLSLAAQGLLSIDEAAERLKRLGYPGDDAAVLVARARRALAVERARAEAAGATTQRERDRAQAALVRAQRAELAFQRAELARTGNQGQLRRWLAKGLITEADARKRLERMGMEPNDVNRFIADMPRRPN
jgi:hypothetical protein